MDPVAETVGRPTLGRGQSPTAQLTAHPSDYIWTLSGPCRPAPALPASQEQGQALGGAQELPAHPWPNALLTAEPGAEGEGQDSFRETQSQPLLPTGPERRPGAKYASIFPGDEEQPLLKGAPARAGSGLLVGAEGWGAMREALRPSPSCTEALGWAAHHQPPSTEYGSY